MTSLPEGVQGGRLDRLGAHFDGLAHWYYVALAVPMIVFLVVARGPLGAPDEWSHVARAAQVAQGVMLAPVVDGVPKGAVDDHLRTLQIMLNDRYRMEPVPDWAPQYRDLAWGHESIIQHNQAVYYPLVYIPQALSLLAAWAVGLGILDSLVLGSLVTGLVCVALGGLAIRLAPMAKVPLTVVLALPMPLFLFASFSPDGLLIGAAAVLASAVARLWAWDDPGTRRSWILLLIAFGAALLLGPGKVVYAPLAAAVLGLLVVHPGGTWRTRGAAVVLAALAFAASIGWHLASQAGAVDYGPGDPARQLAFSATHPLTVLGVWFHTVMAFGTGYLQQLIGVLGWLDAPLPSWAMRTFLGLLVAALVAEGLVPARVRRMPWWLGVGLVAVTGAVVAAIFFSLYLIWTPPEATTLIEGVQGRYFLPLLPPLLLLVLMLPLQRRAVGWRMLGHGLRGVVILVLPLLVPAAIVTTILVRYYE